MTKYFHNNYITVSEDFIITTPYIKKEPTESLGSTFFTHLKLNADKLAQIEVKTGRSDTFGQILKRTIRTAIHMKNKNINQNHIITMCTWNHLNSVVPYLASLFLGAKVASVDPSFAPEEMSYLLKQVRPRMIFVVPELVPTIEKILSNENLTSEIVVFGETSKYVSFEEFLQPCEDEDAFVPTIVEDLKETALIHFSSGTTGLPKGICLSHWGLLGQMINARIPENFDAGRLKVIKEKARFPFIHLCYTTLYWLSATGILISSILEGHCRLVCQKFDGQEIWDLIEKYKPLVLTLTPVQVIEMLANRRDDVEVDCVLSVGVIGSGISTEYILKLREFFPNADVIRGYGQTEVSGGLTLFKSHDVLGRSLMKDKEKIESVGLPLRGVAYRVVDLETGKNVGPNQIGELRVKTSFVMNGYHNLDSSETFDEDGWLKTGDVVYYDKDFCFYIVDRIKEAFKYQGWFIAPTVLENVLLKHPAVKYAVVVGIPKDDGHHPMGLVVLNDGWDVSEKEIEEFVEERVPERQRLRAGVKLLETIPLTVTGKVNRREIKQMVVK